MFKLNVYKINTGIFIKPDGCYFYDGWYVNDRLVSSLPETKKFYFLAGATEIISIKRTVEQRRHIIGYTLSEPSLASDKIPMSLSTGGVDSYYDDDLERTVWRNYEHLRSLYSDVYCEPSTTIKDVEFEVNNLGTYNIENVSDPINMKITMSEHGAWNNKVVEYDLENVVSYHELETLLTPEFLLHERPCKLTSEQVYKIVREHVKQNIDGSYARITSDYDFCFDVAKLVYIKPIIKQTEIKNPRGKSYARPKFQTSTITTRAVKVFSMTHDRKKYAGYPIISGFEAANLKEMAEQVKFYLDTLMETINMPAEECSHCAGTGHIIVKPELHKKGAQYA